MTRRSVPPSVPEGGWGWIVCLASFWINGATLGVINSFGVLYVAMLNLEGADAFKTSWVGSVCAGLTFFMSPFASIITDKLGCRPTAVIGSTLALVGVLGSSFATRIEHLYITYGLAMGIGFSFAYQPSLYILGVYFQKRLGMANGLVSFGCSIFTTVLPLAMRQIIKRYGLKPCLWLLSSIMFVMLVGSLTFRPRPEVVERRSDDHLQEGRRGCCGRSRRRRICTKCSCSSIIDVSIWKERNYRLWAIGMPLGLLGYLVPFFHLVKYVDETLPEARSEVLIMCLGATSGIGKLATGFLSDHSKINPVYIHQLAFLVMGVLTTLLPIMHNFIALCANILVMGFFDGAFASMIGPIAFTLVGPQRASQAIGCVLGIMSIPMMLGPPVAGFLYDWTGNYTVAFAIAGIPPMITVCTLFFIRSDSPSNKDIDHEKPDDTKEKEQESAMTTKEKEALLENRFKDLKVELRGGRLEDGGPDGGFDDNDLQDGYGRRSYRRDTCIIMENHIPHSNHTHHPYGLHSNEDIHKYQGFYTKDIFSGKGWVYELENVGSRSPYAQRNRNHSNHYGRPNGHASRDAEIKFEMNGFVHRSDSHTNEFGTNIKIMDRETTV